MDTLNQALNVLQSIQLPFALIPVLYISTRKDVMGSVFVLQDSFRTLVQVICWLLLGLNFSFVAIAMITWGMENTTGGLTACVVAVFYVAFVVYLIIGPTRVHENLSKSDSPALQLLNKWFGREEGHIAPVLGGGLANGQEEGEMVLLRQRDSPSPREHAANGHFRIGSLDSNTGSPVQAGSLPEGSFPDNGLAEM